MNDIQKNLNDVKSVIAKKAKAFDRLPEDIHLIAVSKMQPQIRIEEMLAAGHRTYGENRVLEAVERWDEKKTQYPDLKLHLIGLLQTNKVKEAVALFDAIHTIDRPKLVTSLAGEMKKQGKNLPCFIQVNTGEEEQKAGVIPQDLPDLLKLCLAEKLNIIGLMCIPPVQEPPALHFAFLRKLASKHGLKELSMGMSDDYERAVALGASYVRVGSALFGTREKI